MSPSRPSNAPAVSAIGPALLRRRPLPQPAHGDKDARGRVLVVAGSMSMPGAAILAATAALRAGAGKLQIATCAGVAPHVAAAVPEALVLGLAQTKAGTIALSAVSEIARRCNAADALVLGPGMGEDASCGKLVRALLRRLETPLVVDAAALTELQDDRALHRFAGRVVITPHAGEMAAILQTSREKIESDPLRAALEGVRRFRAVVVLKGQRTYIATPDGERFCNTHGHVGLATSGSGDTLAGIIGGLLARGAAPADAAVWGVYLHAGAGLRLAKRTGIGFLARELPAEIPPIMRQLDS